MHINTSVYHLSGKNYENGAMLSLALTSVSRNILISHANFQKSFSSFFHASNSNFNLELTHSRFKKFLSSTIKVVSDKYALLDTRSRVVFTRKFDIFMNDCSFTECTAQGLGVDGHGGAICIFVPVEGLFDLNLERINFYKCYAKSSGGSLFTFTKLFKSVVVCFTESFAAKNTIAYVQSNQIIMNNSFCNNNKYIDQFNPSSTTFGFRGETITQQEMNMSQSVTDMGFSCFHLNGYNLFTSNYNIFHSCSSESAINSHSIGKPATLLQNTMFINDTYKSVFISTDVPISIQQTCFAITSNGIIASSDVALLSFRNCYFNGTENDWNLYLSGVQTESNIFGSNILDYTQISLYEAQAGCRDHEMNFKYKKDAEAAKDDVESPSFAKIVVKLLPTIIGLALIFVIVIMIMRKKKKILQKPPTIFSK